MAEGTFGPWLRAALLRVYGDQEDAFALGVVRAAIAGVLFVSALCHVGNVAEYFSDASMINGRFARLAFTSRWSLFFTVSDPTAVRLLWGVGVLALGMWTLGLFTRASALVGMGLWVCMYGRNPLLYAYPDQLAMMMGALLALMPAGRGFSLDARWRGLGGTVPVWCRRLIQLQIGILYTATGLEKTGELWREDYTAIYYTIISPYNRHFDPGRLAAWLQPWLLRPMTFLVLYWEISFAGFLAYHWLYEMVGRRLPAWGTRAREGRPGWALPDARWLFLSFGVVMHIGIQLSVYVMFFMPLVFGSYLAFFTSEDLRAIGARLRRLGRRRATATRGG